MTLRKLLFILLPLLISIYSFSQAGLDGPWMKELKQKGIDKEEYSIEQISIAFEKYWETHDKDKKGSGYKPFKRWEYFWQNNLNEKGNLITNKELWEAWEQKVAMQNDINVNDVESDWSEVGPLTHVNTASWSAGSGRVNVIIVDPNNPNTIYLGTPAGGIWKSVDEGVSWIALSDDLPRIGVSGIAIDPNNSDVIYISTGDSDGGDTYSIGVMKSIDGGASWEMTGLTFESAYEKSNEIFINPENSDMLWVATSDGLRKTVDGGSNWYNVLTGDIGDLKLNPANPAIVYAVKYDRFYKSDDYGETFTQINSAIPNNLSRAAIAVTPANPSLVYVLGAKDGDFKGIYKSFDNGDSFIMTDETTDIFDGSGQSYYDMAIAVSDVDENIVFVGVLNIWKSIDGGNNFVGINNWSEPFSGGYTHADIHYLRYYNGKLYAGTDGGIYRSTNNGLLFSDLSAGLAIGQFYKISISNNSNKIVGGLQDNGGYIHFDSIWKVYHGADGMDCVAYPFGDIFYGFIQNGGSLYKSTDGGNTNNYVASAPGEGGNWVTPLVANSFGDIFAGYEKLYYLQGNNFFPLSEFEFGGNIDEIEVDPSNDDVIFVAKDYNLFKTSNYGETFVPVNYSFENSISSIEVNNNNSNIVYVTTSGNYGKVLKSSDGGETWEDITYNLPAESKNVIRHQGNHPFNPIYLGTSLGVYYKDDLSEEWQVFSTNLPNVPVRDLEITPQDGIITAGTFGRGVWQSPIPLETVENDISLVDLSNPISKVNCGSVTPSVLVENKGVNTISSVDINYKYDDDDVVSFQWTGQILTDEEAIIELPEAISNPGFHIVEVETTINEDEFDGNNSNSFEFFINENINSSIVFEFDNSNDGFVSVELGQGELFRVDEPSGNDLDSAYSGTTAFVNIGIDQSTYLGYSDSRLYSNCYNLSNFSNPVLDFYMAFEIQNNHDVLYMEYSIDGGSTWNVLGAASDENWYNNDAVNYPFSVGGQWSGNEKAFNKYSHSLNFISDENNVLFRYVFKSNSFIESEGCVIDDFSVHDGLVSIQNLGSSEVNIYPNPVDDFIRISLSSNIENGNCKVQVFNSIGQIVFSDNYYIYENSNIPSKNLIDGVYTLKLIFENDKVFNGKFIVKH